MPTNTRIGSTGSPIREGVFIAALGVMSVLLSQCDDAADQTDKRDDVPSVEQRWNESAASGESWHKSDGLLSAMLQLTDEPDEFFAAWKKGNRGVRLSETSVAHRGSPIVALVFFTGCAADAKGLSNATVIYTVLRPDGTMYNVPEVGELWINKPPPARSEIQLGIACLGVVIEPQDPPGRYTVRAAVEDRIAHKKMTLERTFEAVEAQE